MTTQSFTQHLLAKAGFAYPESVYDKLDTLYELLLEENAKVNLTRITSPEAYAWRHVAESLLFSLWLPQEETFVDLGPGGGFPCFPILLARPDLTGLAIESVGKKCAAITRIAERLNMTERLTVLAERFETVGQMPTHRERYKTIVARAVAPLPVLLEYAAPLLRVGGQLLALKGPSWQEEVFSAQSAFKKLHMELTETATPGEALLPELEHCHLLFIKKRETTAKAYPRKAGLPAKQPL